MLANHKFRPNQESRDYLAGMFSGFIIATLVLGVNAAILAITHRPNGAWSMVCVAVLVSLSVKFMNSHHQNTLLAKAKT